MGWLFEWDSQKAQSNFEKHGVSFEEAGSALDDPLEITRIIHHGSAASIARPCIFTTTNAFVWRSRHSPKGESVFGQSKSRFVRRNTGRDRASG